MANSGSTGSTSGIPWDLLHKILTGVLASATIVLGGYQFQLQHKLKVEQEALNQKVQNIQLVDQMLKRIEDYLDKYPDPKEENKGLNKEGNKGLNARDKTRIRISLLKLATEVHLAEAGKADPEKEDLGMAKSEKAEKKTQEDRLREIPLIFALLSDDEEMLVTISTEPDDIGLWVEYARSAGDAKVQATAAGALERIAILTTDVFVQEKVINSLLELAADWQDPDINNPVIVALKNVLQRIDGEDLEETDRLAEAVNNAEVKINFLTIQSNTAAATKNNGDKENPEIDKQELIKQVNLVFEKMQVRQESDPEIKKLIKALEDDDKNIRRSARSKLGSVGASAVPLLLEALKDKGTEYRVRLGVITAFLLMEPPVQIPEKQIQLVASLLGDLDSTVRKNTANFLIANLKALDKAKDSDQAIKSIVDALSVNLSKHDNANGVYNSVVVLGEVLKQMSETSTSARIIREQLIKAKGELGKEHPRAWQKTLSQVEKYLKKE
jgi:hypothetical protein